MFGILLFQINAQHKIAERYIIQELISDSNSAGHIYFAPYHFASNFEYYFVEERDLIDFILSDSVDRSKLILTFEKTIYFTYSDTALMELYRFNKFMGLNPILLLDDSEIYKIGGRMYILKKMKYAYLDNIPKVYTLNSKMLSMINGDNIPSDIDNRYQSVEVDTKKYFDKDEFEVFLYMIEQIPTSPKIKKNLWLKRYQMFD